MKKILDYIDNILNKITMYRLVLYDLCFLLGVAGILTFFGKLPFTFLDLSFSIAFILTICWITNKVFSWAYNAPTNVESVYITALILALIITPLTSFNDTRYFALAFWASVWSMASKYIFAIKKRHLFNPAAIAVVITYFFLGLSASWWVGTAWMMPFVLIGGLLVTRKILRFDLVWSFLAVALTSIVISHLGGGTNVAVIVEKALFDSSILFFAFVMLTEPLTTPPTSKRRMLYAAFTGLLYTPALHVGSIASSPELALTIGNIFSYIVGSKQKLLLTLKQKIQLGPDMYDLVFESDQKLKFEAGQYLEWTLAHKNSDNRGNRRYFTVASSPIEKDIRMGVKFYPNSSTFKQKLLSLKEGEKLMASQLAGDFTLPKDPTQKLVFIAGGIGITPFRSIAQYLMDTKEKRDIVMLYSNKTISEIAYKDIFDNAKNIGLKAVYTVTHENPVPQDWAGKTGFINEEMIKQEVPDYKDRMYYLSGPHGMVVIFSDLLKKMGVPDSKIKKDFFPGFV